MAESSVVHLTKDNFDRIVYDSDKPVIVDFWAPWCGPCRMVAPVMEQLAQEYDGKAVIGKVNVDDESELAAKFRIMSIPTVIMFKDGKVIEKIIGARPKSDFAELLDRNI
ncbi:MAG: thioredoxin [Bacillota bacterium]